MNQNLTLRDHKSGDEVFQHDEGSWNVTAIREGIDTEPETFKVIDMPLTRTFIDYCKLNIGVSIKRARELNHRQVDDPGMIILRQRPEGLNCFMIDGHHRAVRRWRDGKRSMKVFVIAEEVGEMWRIKDTLMLNLDKPETSEGKTKQ
jgi:hypothetical protein